jgi:hypothetical protein
MAARLSALRANSAVTPGRLVETFTSVIILQIPTLVYQFAIFLLHNAAYAFEFSVLPCPSYPF